jgi:hypothetical protein
MRARVQQEFSNRPGNDLLPFPGTHGVGQLIDDVEELLVLCVAHLHFHAVRVVPRKECHSLLLADVSAV